MLIKGITDEDFVNYKVPSMYIATATCSFKCDKEYGKPICQNSALVKQPTIFIPSEDIIKRYISNPITHAIVIGGLEPFDDEEFGECELFQELRWQDSKKRFDDIVIYTGYNKYELNPIWFELFETYAPIVIKYGRYIPGQQPHLDPVLGVMLASDNQYAERIS